MLHTIKMALHDLLHGVPAVSKAGGLPISLSDAAAQLNDVFQETEEAVFAIINAASIIGKAVETRAMPPEMGMRITEQLNAIYMACNFQDLSSQRIKNALRHLDQMAQAAPVLPAPEHSLMNGHASLVHTSAQRQIDYMFGTAFDAPMERLEQTQARE